MGEPRRPQDKVQQRTMEQLADDVPMLSLLASPVPQMVDQLVAVLARYDRSAQDFASTPLLSLQFFVRRR